MMVTTGRGRAPVVEHAVGDAVGVVGFEGFFRAEYRSMVALAAAVSGDRAAAEDIAQEAFGQAHRSWDRVQALDRPGAWVRRVTINLAISTRRRAIVRTDAAARLGAGQDADPIELPDDSLLTAVGKLPPGQRVAVALHYLEDRPVEEVAEIMGCSKSTAKVHLHRGRRALAEALAPVRFEEEAPS